MKKFAVLGSCLSGSISKELVSMDFELTGTLTHQRLDAFACFLAHFKGYGYPDLIGEEIMKACEKSPDKEHIVLSRISQQTITKLNNFKELIKSVDFLIVDNNYDLSLPLTKFQINGEEYILNVGTSPVGATDLGLMEVNTIESSYGLLIDNLRKLNPEITIFYVNFPNSGYLGRPDISGRVDRSIQFSNIVCRANNMESIPLVNIPAHYLSSKGAQYFDDHIYTLYAKLISKLAHNKTNPWKGVSEIDISDLEVYCNDKKPKITSQTNPYKGLPDRQFWKKSIADRFALAIDQLYDKKFPITPQDNIATCGSCFAQHIGKRLHANGFNYMDVEKAPESLPRIEWAKHGYGIYSARYGNIYTSRQLLQLIERAFGFRQEDEVWEMHLEDNGICYADPFRPNITAGEFDSPEDVIIERNRHLAAVKDLLCNLDVLIFTMGLTECWQNIQTGAVYPVAPGVTSGTYDPEIHTLLNLNYVEIMQDMNAIISIVKQHNPDFKLLLTVSPVPLTATAEHRHVLVSTVHSKSILRAVAGELADSHQFVDYFPSYEIVASHPFRGMFFQNNLRTVHDQGVDFVMKQFFSQHKPDAQPSASSSCGIDNEEFCDEVFLELEQLVGKKVN